MSQDGWTKFIVVYFKSEMHESSEVVLTITGALNNGELSATIFFTDSGSLPTV